jgi:cob(I)alamin adenosyltransferase
MGHRLSKIYTRTGDKGTTGLGDSSRTDKDAIRIEAFGTVDELNSAIGLLLAEDGLPQQVRESLDRIQHELFDLGGELCIPGHTIISAEFTERLERELDALNEHIPPLKEFILPGGNRPAALCHLARAICRRAERRVVTLAREETTNSHALIYLNRLSDLLFVAARTLARQDGGEEVMWRHEH